MTQNKLNSLNVDDDDDDDDGGGGGGGGGDKGSSLLPFNYLATSTVSMVIGWNTITLCVSRFVTWGLKRRRIISSVPLILVTITGYYIRQDMSIPTTCFGENLKKKKADCICALFE